MQESNNPQTNFNKGKHSHQYRGLYTSLISKPQSNDETPNIIPNLATSFIEIKSILSISLPMILTGLLLYSRSMTSMFFLGRLGRLPLAGGSLAIGFANLTGYSVLSGLATAMDPICGQAHGAGIPHILAFRRTILLLLSASLPISLLWLFMRRILLFCRQDSDIADAAQSFLLFSLPDLALQSFIHPLRIYF